MRLKKKEELINILKLVKKLHAKIDCLISRKDYVVAQQLLVDCQQTAIDIGCFLEKVEKEETIRGIIEKLEIYCEKIFEISEGKIFTKQCRKEVDSLIDETIFKISEIPSGKKIFVFMPYKASMWTSLESIWKAASEDENCEAVVMPIPYFEIGKHVKELHMEYEGDKFPKYVPITDWTTFSLEDVMPDVIFIHNPYDDGNTLTTIHPNYYSDVLKQYTDCLVYVPYFTMGSYIKGRSDFQYVNKGTENADKVIVQSDFVKKIYQSYGHSSDKLVVTGSPKTDAIVNRLKDKFEYPEEWISKLEGKKVFLLNTHLSYFPTAYLNRDKYGYDYAQRYHEQILKAVLNNTEWGLIWRPHPLLFSMANNNFPECVEYAEKFAERIEKAPNCVLDCSADYMMAFSRSDALITTYSSLVNEYLITEKPVMIFQTRVSDENANNSPIDMRVNYFRFPKSQGMTFEQFMQMVTEGQDPRKQERMDMLNDRAFANLDGTAGRKAFTHILSYLEEREVCKR